MQLDSLCKLPTETFTKGSFDWDQVVKPQLVGLPEMLLQGDKDRRAPFTKGKLF